MRNRDRKISPVLLAVGIFLVMLFSAVPALASTTMKTTQAVKLRTGPSSSAAVIITIPKGKKVTAGISDSGFTKVIYKTGSKAYGGWAWSNYLKKTGGSSGSGTDTGTTKQVATAIYLRTGPGTNYPYIRVIPGGGKVKILGFTETWYRVSYNGVTGYIKQGYLTNETMVREVRTAIYLRSTPTSTTDSNIRLVVPAYGKVTVYGRYTGNWYRVSYKGTSGYMYGGYFTTESYNEVGTVRIVKTAIYLRSYASASGSSNIILTVPTGAEVTVLSRVSSSWLRVRYGSTTGYMRDGYFL
jgi:uncharacterized protein YgiM (DUF1202 family)